MTISLSGEDQQFSQVLAFHLTFNHPIREYPYEGTEAERRLRAKLILEEAFEFANACGFVVMVRASGAEHATEIDDVVLEPSGLTPNLTEMADGLADLLVVTHGANLVFGVPERAVFNEVHASNMSKLGGDGKPIYREDGKILKGPGYFKPDIASILAFYTRLAQSHGSERKAEESGDDNG